MSMSCNNIPGPGHVFSNLFYCRIIHRLSTHLTLPYKYKYDYKYNFTGDILTRLTLLQIQVFRAVCRTVRLLKDVIYMPYASFYRNLKTKEKEMISMYLIRFRTGRQGDSEQDPQINCSQTSAVSIGVNSHIIYAVPSMVNHS